jgi:hypothetical protein
MTSSKLSEYSTIGGFCLYAILTLIDRWNDIFSKEGSVLSKIALGFLIFGIISTGIFWLTRKKEKLEKKGTPTERPKDLIQVKTINRDAPEQNKLIAVMNKAFVNQRVLLDGYIYSKCKFENVTLVYNGEGPFALVEVTFQGLYGISSDSPNIQRILKLMKDMGYLKEEVKLQ